MHKQTNFLSVRVDPLWLSWLDRLTEQSGRESRSGTIRDVIMTLTVLPELGDEVSDLMKSEQVHYDR